MFRVREAMECQEKVFEDLRMTGQGEYFLAFDFEFGFPTVKIKMIVLNVGEVWGKGTRQTMEALEVRTSELNREGCRKDQDILYPYLLPHLFPLMLFRAAGGKNQESMDVREV